MKAFNKSQVQAGLAIFLALCFSHPARAAGAIEDMVKDILAMVDQQVSRAVLAPLMGGPKAVAPELPKESLASLDQAQKEKLKKFEEKAKAFGQLLPCASEFKVRQPRPTKDAPVAKPEAIARLKKHLDEMSGHSEKASVVVKEMESYKMPTVSDISAPACDSAKGFLNQYQRDMSASTQHLTWMSGRISAITGKITPYYSEHTNEKHFVSRIAKDFGRVNLQPGCRYSYRKSLQDLVMAAKDVGDAIQEINGKYIDLVGRYVSHQRDVASAQVHTCESIEYNRKNRP